MSLEAHFRSKEGNTDIGAMPVVTVELDTGSGQIEVPVYDQKKSTCLFMFHVLPDCPWLAFKRKAEDAVGYRKMHWDRPGYASCGVRLHTTMRIDANIGDLQNRAELCRSHRFSMTFAMEVPLIDLVRCDLREEDMVYTECRLMSGRILFVVRRAPVMLWQRLAACLIERAAVHRAKLIQNGCVMQVLPPESVRQGVTSDITREDYLLTVIVNTRAVCDAGAEVLAMLV